MLKKGKHVAVLTSAKVLIAVLLLASVVGLPMPKLADWWQGEVAEAAPSDQSPGQLKRRGISGTVVTATSTTTFIETGTSTSTPPTIGTDAYTITISTKFGDVTVLINDETVILAPPNGIITVDQISFDDRLAIHFKKSAPKSASSTDPFLDSSARIALKIIVIPGRPSRSHVRGVVSSKVRGKLRLVDDDGNETDLTNAPDGIGDGDDVVLVARRNGQGSGDLEIRGFQPASRVTDRLTNLIERARDSGDLAIVRRLEKRIDKVIDQLEERLRKAKARFSRNPNTGVDNSGSDDDSKGRGKNGDGSDNSGSGRGQSNRDSDSSSGDDDGDKASPGKGRGRR